jgi:hypothetical protein
MNKQDMICPVLYLSGETAYTSISKIDAFGHEGSTPFLDTYGC